MKRNLSKNLLFSCTITVWSGMALSFLSSSPAEAAISYLHPVYSNTIASQAEEPNKNRVNNNVKSSLPSNVNARKSDNSHGSLNLRGLLSFLGIKKSTPVIHPSGSVLGKSISQTAIQSFNAGPKQNPSPNSLAGSSGSVSPSLPDNPINNLNNGPIDQKTGGYIPGWHSLGLIGVKNARDAGDYITQDGHIFQPGKLYRSNNLQHATAADDKTLAEHNVTTIIDLRTSIEDAIFPDQKIPGTRVIHQDIVGSLIPFEGALTAVAQVAHNIASVVEQLPVVHNVLSSLENTSHSPANTPQSHSFLSNAFSAIATPVKDVFNILKNGVMDTAYAQFVNNAGARQELGDTIKDIIQYTQDGQAVLIHCSAGKDRTGWVSALVQTEVGIDPSTVRKDYLTSTSNGFPVENQYIDSALNEVKRNYGTIDNYVHKGLGLTDQDINQLKVSLLI